MKLNELKDLYEMKSTELEVYNYKLDDAIIAALQLFELKLSELQNINYANPIWKRERIYDLQEALALIIEWIYRYGSTNSTQTTSGQKNFSMIEDAFKIANDYLILETSIKSISQGLMKEQKQSEVDTIYVDFISSEVAYFEAVNEIILTDYNRQKVNKMPEIDVRKMQRIGIIAGTAINSRMKQKLDIEFELPDNYVIGPYSIKQIKEIWGYVMTKAFLQLMDNISNIKYTPLLMQLLEMEKFTYKYSSKNEINGLLNDLTYRGNYKKKNSRNKEIYSNFLTEPILEIDGVKHISPSIVLNYQVSRNILSTLNRIYGDDSHKQKAEQFNRDIIKYVEVYPNLLYAQEVPIKKPIQTDVDFALFDQQTETLLIFEIKWFNEPVTPIEIKSKDAELEKATIKQLPNCYSGILHNPTEFINKAFKVKLSNPKNLNLQGYVLTRCTVGSGNINRNNFEVINLKMLLTALKDCNGDLLAVKQLLNDRAYYPKKNVNFNFDTVTYKIGDYELKRGGYSLLKPFNYEEV